MDKEDKRKEIQEVTDALFSYSYLEWQIKKTRKEVEDFLPKRKEKTMLRRLLQKGRHK